MRAVVVREFGGPEVLVAGDVPAPVPRAGEVLVRVGYANITFVETQVRAGRAPFPAPTPPYIPGNGVGGVTESGRRVVTSTGGTGAYAEYVAVPADEPIDVPDGLDLADAVALLADGRTAAALAAAAQPLAGQRVLVLAAAGGVGSLLVQLAKRAGATVVAAAGSDVKLDRARTLGADVTVNYRVPGWTREVDVVFDGVGGDIGRAAFESLRDGGRMFIHGLASGSF
ncbi:MAG TPA: zinc-binding dehydrogenase, partial [Pseudonocardiaceae bacterium]|nr:zinc-binding dehydrogenase [Pseudonocardiaceae bacterium]